MHQMPSCSRQLIGLMSPLTQPAHVCHGKQLTLRPAHLLWLGDTAATAACGFCLQLCRTYDAAEACRNVHEDRAWRMAATQACMDLSGGQGKKGMHAGCMQGHMA